MNALLEHFQGERVLLLLDNFEPVVNPETQEITDKELDEALCALVSGPHHMVNALITTRVAPRELNLCEPGRQRVLTLDEGLESPYAENILREMDEDGKLGLKAREETDPLLQRAREKTRGYPRALEALFAILSSDRYTTLEELLEMPSARERGRSAGGRSLQPPGRDRPEGDAGAGGLQPPGDTRRRGLPAATPPARNRQRAGSQPAGEHALRPP